MKERIPRLLKKVWFVLLIFITASAQAQTLRLDTAAFVSGNYGSGSDISVLFQVQGCFTSGNAFELVLSDASGQFTNNSPVIGSDISYFATFLNGQIPYNVPAGNGYRLMLRSTLPLLTVYTPSFSIQTGSSVVRAAASVAQPLRILKTNYAYGFCTNPIVPQQLPLIDGSSSGASISGRLKDDLTQSLSATYQYNAGSTQGVALDRSYYTYLIRSEKNGILATRAYSLINSRNRIILGVDGEQQGCLPQELTFQIGMDANSGGIEHNYPGTEYLVEWGDATSTIYRLCDLLASNGVLKHSYNNTSCNRPGVTYNITVSVIQPWNGTAGCDRPQVTTRAKISKRPQSFFALPDTGCQGSSVNIRNLSDPGQQVFGAVCVARADYFWYVNGNLVASFFDKTPLQANLNYTFNSPGINIVRLVVDNQGCMESELADTICITARPLARISSSAGDQSISGCVPFSFSVLSNTSLVSCRPTTLMYEVKNARTKALLNAGAGIFSVDSAGNYQFSQPGKYWIIQRVQNYCGHSSDTLTVNVNTAPRLMWSAVAGRCDTGTLRMADTITGPRMDSLATGTQYMWTITGGSHLFAAGSNAQSALPSIRLLSAGTYALSVLATNACGQEVKIQQYTVQPRPVAAFQTFPGSICFYDSIPALQLTTNVTVPDSIVWSHTGTGAFTGSGLQNQYLASAADRLSGSIQITARLYSAALYCSGPVAQQVIAFLPDPGRSSRTLSICSGAAFPAGNPATGSLSFTTQLMAGSVSGFSPSGNAYPQDLLINNSHTQAATLLYTFTATQNGCSSLPFTDTVQVHPVPVLGFSSFTDTICSGGISQIPLSASVPSVYSWTVAVQPANAAIGFVPQPVGASLSHLAQPIQLTTGQSAAVVEYRIRAISIEGCISGEYPAQVMVKPGNSAALAGPDQLLCQATSASLSAMTPVRGTGSWSLIHGQGNLQQPLLAQTQISGLRANDTVVLVYTVSGYNGCNDNTDTVRIISRNPVAAVSAGAASPLCTFEQGNIDTMLLNAQSPLSNWETGRWSVIVQPAGAQTAIINSYAPSTPWVMNQPGTYKLEWRVGNDAGCPEKTDTLQVHVFEKPKAPSLILPGLSCSADTVLIGHQGLTGQIFQWEQAGAGQVFQSFVPYQNTHLLPSADTQYLRVRVRSLGFNAGCTQTDVSVVAVLPRIQSSVAGTLVGDDTLCGGNNAGSIQLTQAVGTVNAWQFSLDGGSTWQTQSAGGSSLSYINLTQNTLYRAQVQNNICAAVFTAPLALTIHGGISHIQVQGQQSICLGNTAGLLSASLQTNGFGGIQHYWETSTDSINYAPVSGASTLSYAPGIPAETRWFRLQANAAVCGSQGFTTSAPVKVEVLPLANAGFQLQSSGCAPFPVSVASAQTLHYSLSQQWYINGRLASQQQFPGHTIQQPGDTAIITLKMQSLYGCGTDSFTAQAITAPLARPAVHIPSFNACGPVQPMIQNTSPDAAGLNFYWSFGNGQFSTLTQPGQIAFDPHPLGADTTYPIVLKAMNACDTAEVSTFVLIKSKPVVTFSPDKTTGCSPFPVAFTNTTLGNNTYQWQFGDQSPVLQTGALQLSHTYATGTTDTFHVTLSAHNSCGHDSLTYSLVVQPSNLRIDMAVNGSEAAGCAPFAVQLINNSRNGQQFHWDFGDGQHLQTLRNLDTVTHVFVQPGQYQVKLRASNSCSDTTTTETIFIGRRPVAHVLPHAAELCIGDSLLLQAGSDSAQQYEWLADAKTYHQPVVNAVMSRSGLQTLRLLAIRGYNNGLFCTDTLNRTVMVNTTTPGKMFISDTAGNCGPLQVKFHHSYPGSITRWVLDNGTQLSGDTARHIFNANGQYKIRMEAVASGGCIRTDSATVRVQSPTGTAQYNTRLACGGTPVQFHAQFSGADSIRWIFGDGSTATTNQTQIQHTYQGRGSYLPQAILVANGGKCLLPLPLRDSIVADKMNAGFVWQTEQNCGQTVLRLRDTVSAGGNFQHQWVLGNGQQSQLAAPSAVYHTSNPYQVKLKMTTGSGCSDSVMHIIPVQVHALPVAAILGDSLACIGSVENLRSAVLSQDSILRYEWSGPNGQQSAVQNITFTPLQTGFQTIRLIATTIHQCADTALFTLAVKAGPQVRASEDASICRGDQISIMASGASQYQWSPANNLSCINCALTQTNTTQTRRYVVTGTVAGNACPGSDTVWVRVAQPFEMTVGGGDSICQGEVARLEAGNAYSYQWMPAAGLSSSSVATPLASPTATTRYRVIGRDSAGCFSDTGYVTVGVGKAFQLSLGADRQAATGDKITLKPVISGPDAISTWKWNGKGLNCSDCPQPVLTVQGNAEIWVQATSSFGCTASDTLRVKGFCESTQVFIANAFTPDHDGRNDFLYVQGKGISVVRSFRVYNRWGQVVFEKTNMLPNDPRAGWDGTIRGLAANTDVYVYTAEVVCDNNVSYTYKGNSTLIR